MEFIMDGELNNQSAQLNVPSYAVILSNECLIKCMRDLQVAF